MDGCYLELALSEPRGSRSTCVLYATAKRMTQSIVVLNGPAGVGKTTVSRHLMALIPGTVLIPGDVLREFAPVDARDVLGPGSTYRAAAALIDAYLQMGAPQVVFEYVFE